MDKKTRERVLYITKNIYENLIKSTKGLDADILEDSLFVTGMFNAITNLLCQIGDIAGLTEDQIIDNVKQIWSGVKDLNKIDFLN